MGIINKLLSGARGPTFEVLQGVSGKWFFHERAANGQIKNVSEHYSSKTHAVRAAKRKAAETANAKLAVAPTVRKKPAARSPAPEAATRSSSAS